MDNFCNSKEHGFTLVELLIGMTIGLIVLGALVSTLVIQNKSYAVQEQVTEMTQNARAAMDMMTHEIQLGGYDPTNAGFSGIPYNVSQLQILADIDDDAGTGAGDGDTNDVNENITYTFDAVNNRITRDTGSGAEVFAENIDAFTFAYLDANGNSTTTTANIRQIRITITAKTDKPDLDYDPNSGYRAYTLTSLVTPKNLAL